MSLIRNLSLATRGARNFLTKRPFCISFEVTHSCNANCKHCHLGGPIQEERAAPERFGELCREFSPVVAQASGGEPLLRTDLEQIIAAFRVPNRAPYIVVTTNGVLLSKERYSSLREAGVEEFSISLDYPDERHDEFRSVPGLFRRIETLVSEISGNSRGDITLCCVIQRDNFRDLVRMAKLAKDWNVKINFSTYTTMRTHDQDYMLTADELEEFRHIVSELLACGRANGNINTSSLTFRKFIDYFDKAYAPRCRTGDRFFNVNPDGTISPCGLIRTHYKTREDFLEEFASKNHCQSCFTSIRANSEKPLKYLFKDNLKFV